MPPGATHAAFAMRDANDFLIRSESMPAVSDSKPHVKDSNLLENGYAYKPGLFALIKLGQAARGDAEEAGQDTAGLQKAIADARKAYDASGVSDEAHSDVIRSLRVAIREQDGAPQSEHALINRFPTEPLF